MDKTIDEGVTPSTLAGSDQNPEQEANEAEERAVKEALGEHYDESALRGEEPSESASQGEEEEESSEEERETPEGTREPEEETETHAEETSSEQKREIVAPEEYRVDDKPTRLDRRIAKLYTHNLLLKGEDAPSEKEIYEALAREPFKEKENMLHTFRMQNKQLRNVRHEEPTDREDTELLRDEEREAIRQEVRREEYEKQMRNHFVQFIDAHPELDENTKQHNPRLAKAVATLFQKGMRIDEAYDIVVNTVTNAQESKEREDTKTRQQALSGAVSASPKSQTEKKSYTWADMEKLMIEDQEKWEELVRSGYTPNE